MTKPFEHPRWSDEAMAPIEITPRDKGKRKGEDDPKNKPKPPRPTGR